MENIDTRGEFVDALYILNDYCHRRQFGWDVLGETHSYLHTMRVGGAIARREHWDNISVRDCNILLGRGRMDREASGEWGLLGDLSGAGTVVNAFKPPGQPEVRSYGLDQIQKVVAVKEAGIAEAAKSAVANIEGLHRFGPAAPTRLLALACPGRLVSVNGPSAPRLGEFAKRLGAFPNKKKPDADYLAGNYDRLLELTHGREWYRVPEPVNPRDREIWRCRAALVDAFVYIPDDES